jgi:hypothetical protein
MKIILSVLLFLTFSATANADVFQHPLLAQNASAVEKQIPQPEILKTEFKQIKKIAGLQKDLISSGKLIYAKDKGFSWEISKPFAVTYILTQKGLMQIEDGKKTLISADKQAFFNEFSQILQSIFSGKYEQLSQHFTLFFTGDAKQWNLGLRPTDKTVQSVITEISVTGGKNTERIFIKEQNGDTTEIKLSNNLPQKLTSEEENSFNF